MAATIRCTVSGEFNAGFHLYPEADCYIPHYDVDETAQCVPRLMIISCLSDSETIVYTTDIDDELDDAIRADQASDEAEQTSDELYSRFEDVHKSVVEQRIPHKLLGGAMIHFQTSYTNSGEELHILIEQN